MLRMISTIATVSALAACGGSPTSPAHGTVSSARGTAPSAKPAAGTPQFTVAMATLRAGTEIRVQLDDQIASWDVDPGDRIEANVAETVLDDEGVVVIPVGTQVIGHVAAIRDSGDPDQPVSVALSFDTLMLDGSPIAIDALVADREVEGKTGESLVPLERRASIPEGSVLTLQLEQPLRVQAVEPATGGGYYAPGDSPDPERDPYFRD